MYKFKGFSKNFSDNDAINNCTYLSAALALYFCHPLHDATIHKNYRISRYFVPPKCTRMGAKIPPQVHQKCPTGKGNPWKMDIGLTTQIMENEDLNSSSDD
jgi:hypothetical protein